MVRQGRNQLLLLSLATAAALFGRTAVSPLQETLRIALALTDNQVALLQGTALALPMMLAAVLLGLVIDRYSRVRLLFVFSALGAAGSLLTAAAGDFATLFAARCLIGLTATAIGTTAFSLLADLYPADERGRASMAVVVGQYVGIACAFAVGGLLAKATGPANGWRWALFWMSVATLLAILPVWALREPPRTGLSIQNPSLRQTAAQLWRYRARIVPLLVGLTLLQIAFQPTLVWAAPTLSRSFALAPDRVGAIMASGVLISGIVGSIAGGFLTDMTESRGGPSRALFMLCGLALLGVPAALFPLVPSIVPASVLLALFMTLVSTLEVSGTALFTVIVPNELRGLCIAGLAAGVMIFGVGAGPVIVSLLSGLLGGPALIGRALALVGATAGLLGAAVFAYGGRFFSPRGDSTACS